MDRIAEQAEWPSMNSCVCGHTCSDRHSAEGALYVRQFPERALRIRGRKKTDFASRRCEPSIYTVSLRSRLSGSKGHRRVSSGYARRWPGLRWPGLGHPARGGRGPWGSPSRPETCSSRTLRKPPDAAVSRWTGGPGPTLGHTKGEPSPAGRVETGYCTVPRFEGRGYTAAIGSRSG